MATKFDNPLADGGDDDDVPDKDSGSEGSSKTPMIIGGVAVLVLIVVGVVVSVLLPEDPPAPTPAPPTPTQPPPAEAPPPPPPPPPPVDCGDLICYNGGACNTSVDPPACACTGGNTYLDGATWQGLTCEDRPACSFCGADSYCGLEPHCDPLDPPEPVIAEVTFSADIDSVGSEGTADRAAFESSFANEMSSALDISAESIVVLNIIPGSITIEFAIVPDSNFQTVDGADGRFAFDPEDKLAQLAEMLLDPQSELLTAEGSTFAALGTPISHPAKIPSENLDATVLCELPLKRLDSCNGKLSVDDVCSDRNCMVALEEAAAAAADSCAGVAGFQNLPTAATLGCLADGTVAPVAPLADLFVAADGKCFGQDDPTAEQMLTYLTDTLASTLWSASYDLSGRASDVGALPVSNQYMEGDVYVVDGFGTHFDGNGDRVSIPYSQQYGTDGDTDGGAGFTISFWFTKEVCNAVQDRWEMLYQHTSSEADPFDMFWSPRDSQCVEALAEGADSVVSNAENCAAVTALEDDTACRAVQVDGSSVCEYLPARGTTSGISLAVGCASQFSRSTAGGDIVAIRIKDDAGVNPQFDWQIGCAGSDPGLQGTWIHLAVSVGPDSIRVYADGVEQTMFGFPRSWTQEGGASIENPAYPNPASLSTSLGQISFQGNPSLGNIQGVAGVDLSSSDFHAGYTGRMAWAQIFHQAISANDAFCLFSVSDLLHSCPDAPPTSLLDQPLMGDSDAVTVHGNAAYHNQFGLNFDGDGDWAEVAAPDYTFDKEFTINFWASQTLCKIPGWLEPLFVHATNTTAMSQAEADIASQISIYAICWRGSPMISAQVISKNENDNADAQARAGLMASGSGVIQSGGYASANWLSIGLSVSERSIMLYVDGMPISTTSQSQYGWGWQRAEGSSDDLAGTNQANPDPAQFPTPLGNFYGLTGEPITLGGGLIPGLGGDMNFFEGNLQALAIFDDKLNMYDHDCLYQVLEQSVATCAEPGQPTWTRAGRVNNYYASFMDSNVPDDTTLMGDVFQNGAFGLQFDGAEDYVLVTGDTRDFANDGTFAIAFWFTKPVCSIPGRWEFLFSQLENEDLPVTWAGNSGVDMFIGCGERFQVSSIGGDILRTTLVDDHRHRAMFDIQLDYFDGGVMTDTWIHVVMNVHGQSNCESTFRGRDGAGGRRMQDGTGGDMGSGGACTGGVPDPRDSMTDAERAAMRNRFGGQGQVCDMGGAEVFINGQQLPRDAMGYPCDPQNPCDGSREGFEMAFAGSQIPSSWQQQIEVIAAGGDDPRAMIPMLIGSGMLGPDGTPQRANRPSVAGGDQQPEPQGGRNGGAGPGSTGSANMTANMTTGTGGAGGSDRTGMAARAINVAVPDPTNFSRPLRNFDASDVYRDNRAYEHALDKGGYTPREGRDGWLGDEPLMNGLSPGTHVFHAMQTGGWGRVRNGWSGGYWEIVNADGDLLAGGPTDGVVTDAGGDFEFTIEDPIDYSSTSRAGCSCTAPCSNTYVSRGRTRTSDYWSCPIEDRETCDLDGTWRDRRLCLIDGLTVRIVTRTRAAGISWSIDDGSMYSGPIKSNIYIGGRAGLADDHFFAGSLAGLTINSRPLESNEIECMYLAGEQNIGQCGDPQSVGFYNSLRRERDDSEDDVLLHGHTYLDRDLGAVMDGDRDYVTFVDRGFTDGDFTISFWFQKKTACATPGRWEYLYSESVDDTGAFYSPDSGSAIEIYLSCSRDDRRGGGDTVRTYLRDDEQNFAAFDINIDEFRSGGPVTSQWVHYLLSVDQGSRRGSGSLKLYIDGVPTGVSDDPPTEVSGGDSWRSGRGRASDDDGQQTITFPRWLQTANNLAYPNPEQLNGRLRGFNGLSDIYSTWRDQRIALDNLTADTEYTINFRNAADLGGWFMINATEVDEVIETCVATEHDPAQCLEANGNGQVNISGTMMGFDNDCCTMAGEGACAAGFMYVQGTAGCGRSYGDRLSSTWCVPAATAMTSNCSFTAGDASTCDTAGSCSYTAGVTGVYPNLLTQELHGMPGTATFTTPSASMTASWENSGIFMTMHTPADGWDTEARLNAELVWSIDDTDLAGPKTANVFLGSRSDVANDRFYMGSMANVMVQTNDVDDTQAFCNFHRGEDDLDICDNDPSNLKVDILGGTNLDSRPRWGMTLGGSAHMEDDYGVTLDGLGDYLMLESDDLDYASSGEFSLAFWFTKAVCRNIGDFEVLYSHHADPDAWFGCRHGEDGRCSTCNAGIQVSLGCFSDGTDGWTASSTISGDVIRVEMTDTDCNTAVWDTPLLKGGGGYVTDAWVHFALSTWGDGAHVYVDGESIGSAECRPQRGAADQRAARNICRTAMSENDPASSCAAILGDDGQPACQYEEGEHGFPVSDSDSWIGRWWRWATTSANAAYPSVRHFQTRMGKYNLWQEPRPGRPLRQNVTLGMGRHFFRPGCRGCRWSRTGWGDATWALTGPDGALVAGGEQDGRVITQTGSDVCESGNSFSRFNQEDCLAAPCCRWDATAGLPAGGATQGGGGQCVSGVGDGSCSIADDYGTSFWVAPAVHDPSKCMESSVVDGDCCAGAGQGGCADGYTYAQGSVCWGADADGSVSTICVPDGTAIEDMSVEMTVSVMLPRNMDNTWVIEWMIDDGDDGKQGPVRGPLFLGQPNADEDSWSTAGYAGSIAGVRTWTGALRPNQAKCIYLEANTEVGVCGDVGGVIFEAEYTAGGQAGNDPERDLNGPVKSRTPTILACMDYCNDQSYQYFGLQWGSACQCGNEYGQHGPAPDDDECNWPCRGNIDDSCRAIDEYRCNAVELDGTAATCTNAGDCDYTPEDPNVEVTPATCVAAAVHCASVDLEDEWVSVLCSADGAPYFDVPGGCALNVSEATAAVPPVAESCMADAVTDPVTNCAFTAGDADSCPTGCSYTAPVAGVAAVAAVAECTPIVSEAACNALVANETACTDNPGCTYSAAVMQAESCVATAAEDCSGALTSDDYQSGDASNRATCEGAAPTSTPAGTGSLCRYTEEIKDMCGAADRNSIYEITTGAAEGVSPTYLGCFVDASSDDYLEMFGDTYQDQGESFVGGVEAGFGLTFDGDGDYAMLTRTGGYTSDGTFTVAFWFTKTTCNDPEQPYEMLYSHMNQDMDFMSPHLFIQLGCAHSDVHSTAGSGDIIRIAMQDDQQRRYLFDTPLVNAASAGFVTSTWIHFALAVDTTGARVFLDGVDVSDSFGHPEPTNRWVRFAQTYENLAWPDPTSFQPGTAPGPLGYRAMAGKRMEMLNHTDISSAVSACASFCLSEEGGESYRYMGLQWDKECYCDNQYDGRRLGLSVNRDGSSNCGDSEDHPMPICATDEWHDGACGYSNAVFDATNQSNYLGCWKDGDGGVPADDQWGWGGMTMTMDSAYGDGGDDAGVYWENITLAAGSGSEGGRHYVLHKMGSPSGWADGTYMEVWQDVVGIDGEPEACIARDGFVGVCADPVNGACSPDSTYVSTSPPGCPPRFCPPTGSIPDCSYQAARGAVTAGLTRLTAGGYVEANCTGRDGCSDVDISQRWGNEDRCTSANVDEDESTVDDCAYTAASCGDGCLDGAEDGWIAFDTIADGTEGGHANIMLKVVITEWGNSVSWEIANMDLSWARSAAGFERRQVLASGPDRGHPTLGSTGGDGWYSHQEYTGSIGSVGIYWRPLDEEAVACLYRRSANILTVCVPPEEMSGRPFYTTMNPHDLSADTTTLDYDSATVDSCAAYCADYQYFGLEWGSRCSCDNSYGAYGEVDGTECNMECGGNDMQTCGGRGTNSVYERILDGTGWTDWQNVTTVVGQDAGYVDCQDSTFGVSTPGSRQWCQCMGAGGVVSSSTQERRNDEDGRSWTEAGDFICIGPDGGPGMVRYGSPTFEYKGCYQDRFRDQDGITMYDNAYVDDDFGMTFDGQGDYAEVDMQRNGRWLTDDGTFTVSFWVTKVACSVPSWWETVIAYYKYPTMSTRDSRNSHLLMQMGCASYADSTLEGADVMRIDYLDDAGWRSMADFNMDSSMLDGPETRATDTWVHIVFAVGNEQFKLYADGKDVCGQRRGGPPGRSRGCANVGMPTPSRWRPWTQTPCDENAVDTCEPRDDATEADCAFTPGDASSCDQSMCKYSRNCNAAMSGGMTTGMAMRSGRCQACEDVEAGSDMNPFGQWTCDQVFPWLLRVDTSDQHPWFVPTPESCVPLTEATTDCSFTSGDAASCPGGCNYTAPAFENPLESLCNMSVSSTSADSILSPDITFSTICPLTCGICERGSTVVPGCDITNSSSPGVNPDWPVGSNPRGRDLQSNLFLGGNPSGGRSFTGSLSGLGLFRYPLTQQEASCLFRYGEFDIHVCPTVENMPYLYNAMTLLPAENPFSMELPHREARWSCDSALDDCIVPAITELCVPTAHDPAQCLESPNWTHDTHENVSNINGTIMEFDSDCCALIGDAACAPGFTYMQGTAGCGDGYADNLASTWCIPDTTAVPDCSYDPGQADSCDSTSCTYRSPVRAAQALTEFVAATCEPPPPVIAHCAWGGATCDADLINTDGDAAWCHESSENCLGVCQGTDWCAEAPVDLGGAVCDPAAPVCPDACVSTPEVQAGDPVCGNATSIAAMCTDRFELSGRCTYVADDDDTDADGYTPTCSDPMGTDAGLDYCVTYCRSLGMPYAGLSYSSSCACGNEYIGGGQASPSECDANHDGTMDCGTFDADGDWWRAEGGGECRSRVAVYSTEGSQSNGTEVGCFRVATSMPEGLTLGGDAYLDDSGRRSSGRWWSGVGDVDETTYDDFGIHFDGYGDYAQISGVDNGYAADGTFAISMWVTKPNCLISGKEEILYKHGRLGGRRSAAIMMMYVCSNDPTHQHSTVQESRGRDGYQDINLVRVYLQDDDQKRAVFDVSIDDDGGFVTDTWVHVVVSIASDQIKAYVNGRRQYRVGYPVTIPHSLNEKRNPWLQVGYGQDPHQKCAEFCTGYLYSGVQNTEYGQQCFCDNELPSFDTQPHCTWSGECRDDVVHGQAEPCHQSQDICEGPCSQVTNATWCPATSGQQQAPENSCGADGILCGQPSCEDNEWICTAERLTGTTAFPSADALTALCDTDLHSLAGIGQWMEAGSPVRHMCPVLCNDCTPSTANATACMDTIAVSELHTTSSGAVIIVEYSGCFYDTPDATNDDWQDPEVNAAYPSLFSADMGHFNIDHGYGIGGWNEPPQDFYETVQLSDPAVRTSGINHEFHAHGRENRGWLGGFWEVTSADGDLCDAVTDLSVCEAAGECSVLPDVEASCVPGLAGHTPSACMEARAGGEAGMDDDCCAAVGRGSCAAGYTYVQGPRCGPDPFPVPLFTSYCADNAAVTNPAYDDCSAFDGANASTCAANTAPGCVYTAATQKCGATVIASGTPRDENEFTPISINATGAMSCVANQRGVRGCTTIPMDQDQDTNRAACTNAVATCTFVPASDAGSSDTCVATAVALCADAADEAECTTASNTTAFGPDSTPGCEFTPAHGAVIVHIHTGGWGNYISWALREVASGAVLGSGPDSSPIELGGIKGMTEWDWDSPWDGFTGNIADLLIFVRPPTDDNVNCLYREQQATLGKCRAPESMWRMSFWDSLTTGSWSQDQLKMVSANPSVRLYGAAEVRDGLGIDFSQNRQPLAMRGSYYLMDGLALDPATWNTTLPGLTPEACIARCAADGYQFAGLMAGDQCHCDNTYDLYGEHSRSTFEIAAGSDGCNVGTTGTGCVATCSCSIEGEVTEASCTAAGSNCAFTAPDWSCGGRACKGESDLACGGWFKLAVYNVTSSDPETGYQGCYDDHEANAAAVIRLRDGAEDYAQDASFSVSFWFTHDHCQHTNATGRQYPLYHHSGEYCPDCPPQGIDIFMACNYTSTVRGEDVPGSYIMVWLTDDEGKTVYVDVPFGEETDYSADQYGGSITDAWAHFAITVDGDKMAVYIDGVAVTNYGINSAWADMVENLAAGHLSSRQLRRNDGIIELDSALSGMTFSDDSAVCLNTTETPSDGSVVCAFNSTTGECPDTCKRVSPGSPMLGAYFGAWMPAFFDGTIANLGIARRMLDKSEVACLFRYGETHLGVDPTAAWNGGGR